VRKWDSGVIMFWRLPEEYSFVLYLRVELAQNCKKVRSPIYKSLSLFDIPFSILKVPFAVNTEPESPHNNFRISSDSTFVLPNILIGSGIGLNVTNPSYTWLV